MRIEDADLMLGASRWPTAYYLAGYAVELGLKACILKHIEDTGIIFYDKDYLASLGKCWTHDFPRLLDLAGLTAAFGLARQGNPNLEVSWGIAKDWKESSRYELKTQADAEQLYRAIANDPDGVLTWIRTIW
jgi:HEPN domain-containing protein